jgi:septum formation inhibitor MinC
MNSCFSFLLPKPHYTRSKNDARSKNSLVIEQRLSHSMPRPTLKMSLDDMKSNIKEGISTLKKFLKENKNILDKQQIEYFKSQIKKLKENKKELKELIADRNKNRESFDKFLNYRRGNYAQDFVNKQNDVNKKNLKYEARAREIYSESNTCYSDATACMLHKYSSGKSARRVSLTSTVIFGGHSGPYPKKEPLGSQYALEVIEDHLNEGFVEQDYLGKRGVLGRKILDGNLPLSSREKVEEGQADLSQSFDSNNPNGELSAASTRPNPPDPTSTSKVDLNNFNSLVEIEADLSNSKFLLDGYSVNRKLLTDLTSLKSDLANIKKKEEEIKSDETDKLKVDLLKKLEKFKSDYISTLKYEFTKLKEYCESSKLSEQKETLEKILKTPSDLSFKLFFKLETEIKEKVLEQLKNEIKQINIVSSELCPNESPLTDPQLDIRTITLSYLHTEYLEFNKINQALTRELAENRHRLECEANEIIISCNSLSEKILGEYKLHYRPSLNLGELSAKIKGLKEKEDELKQKLELLKLIRLCNKYSKQLYGKELYKFPSKLSLDDLPEKRKFYDNILCKYYLYTLIRDKNEVEGLDETVKTHTNRFEMALAKRLEIQFDSDDDFSKNWKDLSQLWEYRTELLKEIKDCSTTTDEEYKKYAFELETLCDLQEHLIKELVIDPRCRTNRPYSFETDTDSDITRCNNLLKRLQFQAIQIKNYNQEKEKKAQGLNKLSTLSPPSRTSYEEVHINGKSYLLDPRSGALLSPPSHISYQIVEPIVHVNGEPYRIVQTPDGRQLVSLKECGEIMPSETQHECYNEAMQRKIGRALQEERPLQDTNPLPSKNRKSVRRRTTPSGY